MTSRTRLRVLPLLATLFACSAEPQQDTEEDTSAYSGLLCNLGAESQCACITSDERNTHADAPYDSLEGRILDGATAAPLVLEPGQWLEVTVARSRESYDSPRNHEFPTTKVEPNGHFVLKDLQCNRFEFRIYLHGPGTKERDPNTRPGRHCLTTPEGKYISVEDPAGEICRKGKPLIYSRNDGYALPYAIDGVRPNYKGEFLRDLEGPITVRITPSAE